MQAHVQGSFLRPTNDITKIRMALGRTKVPEKGGGDDRGSL